MTDLFRPVSRSKLSKKPELANPEMREKKFQFLKANSA